MLRTFGILAGALIAVTLLALALRPVSHRADQSQFPIPTPDPAARARDAARYEAIPQTVDDFVGAKVSAMENQRSSDDPIAFDTPRYDTAGMWDISRPTRLTLPEDGFYRVEAQVTVLGSGYVGSPAAPTAAVVVIRNGDETDLVCADSRSDEDPLSAHLLGCGATDWFLAGDYVEVLVTPNRTVESNWPGRGSVSPVMSVERLGG